MHDARVVDQHIDAPRSARGGLDRLAHVVFAGNVMAYESAADGVKLLPLRR